MILTATLLVILTLVISQLTSGIIDMIRGKRFSINFFTKLGGMPSSHSSVVSALATCIYFIEGFSTIFLVTAVFAIFIIRDSYGVRFEVGEQAKYLNSKFKTKFLDRVGHEKSEVFAGVILGVAIAMIGFMVF